MFWTYALNASTEKLNKVNLNDNGITPMKKFSVTTIDNIIKKLPHMGLSNLCLECNIFEGK